MKTEQEVKERLVIYQEIEAEGLVWFRAHPNVPQILPVRYDASIRTLRWVLGEEL